LIFPTQQKLLKDTVWKAVSAGLEQENGTLFFLW